MSYPTHLFDEISDLQDDYLASYENEDMDTHIIKNEIRSRMNKAGYTREKSGTYRDVYSHDNEDHVVKFAIGNAGRKENSAEIRNNTRMSKKRIEDVVGSGRCDGEKYIADILDYQTSVHGWIVMEKVTVTSNNVTVETANQIRQAFADAGVHVKYLGVKPRGTRPVLPVDEIETVNMGVSKDGIPVIFDYAGT